MRGRTNIPPRVGGIVNGAVKNCIVASNNDIEIGDYVQLNLKEGALPVMLKDTGATNSKNAMSEWLFYSFKTFALSDGNVINISPYAVSSSATTVASQVVLINEDGLAEGIRVTRIAVTQGKWVSDSGYGPFSVCKLYEDCFLVIHSAYSEDKHDFCRACLIKYLSSTKTVTAIALDTSGITDVYFKGYGYRLSSTLYAHNALGVLGSRVLRFTHYDSTSSCYAYEVFVDESAATLTCKQLTLNYGTLDKSTLTRALQSFEAFSNNYFGLVYTYGVYCQLSGDTVTTLQGSNIALGTRIESGVYAGGLDTEIALDAGDTIAHTLSDITVAAGATLSIVSSTYVGTLTYDVVFKADALRKQLELQDTWENPFYTGGGTSYEKKFRYFSIVFVKLSAGVVLGIAPVCQIAFDFSTSYSGVSQQQLLTGCYCGVFSFDEETKSFKTSQLVFDTFIAFEEPVVIYSTSRNNNTTEGCGWCGIESAFITEDVARVGLWFYSRYSYSTEYRFNEQLMPFTIKAKDGKVVDFSDKNVVEKYTHHVFGIAKTSGAAGELIEVYIPK